MKILHEAINDHLLKQSRKPYAFSPDVCNQWAPFGGNSSNIQYGGSRQCINCLLADQIYIHMLITTQNGWNQPPQEKYSKLILIAAYCRQSFGFVCQLTSHWSYLAGSHWSDYVADSSMDERSIHRFYQLSVWSVILELTLYIYIDKFDVSRSVIKNAVIWHILNGNYYFPPTFGIFYWKIAKLPP